MSRYFSSLIEKLVAGETLTADEFNELKRLLLDQNERREVDEWLSERWIEAGYADVPVSYDRLKERLMAYQGKQRPLGQAPAPWKRISAYYRQIAAILLVPLILGLTVVLFQHIPQPGTFTAEAPLGQKARVELPDGSQVWLNSGSKITYASDFNRKKREISLEGEAYFDVRKNAGKPFWVHTASLDVQVTGTKFNLNAYNDELVTETALLEGHVNLFLKNDSNDKLELQPGQVISWSAATNVASTKTLDREAAIAWTDNRLVFVDDDFSKLARKIERWYNMEVVYNPDDFRTNKLTVKLLEGEQLGKLLQIIESAIGASCSVEGSKIYITKK